MNFTRGIVSLVAMGATYRIENPEAASGRHSRWNDRLFSWVCAVVKWHRVTTDSSARACAADCAIISASCVTVWLMDRSLSARTSRIRGSRPRSVADLPDELGNLAP